MDEKKKVPLKIWFGEGGLQENFCWRKGLKCLKKGGFDKKGVEKK